jgi:hypothetical protein
VLHASRKVNWKTHCIIVDRQIIMDRTQKDFAGMQAYSDWEWRSASRLPLHFQGGVGGADSAFFIGEGCAEQSHDAVTLDSASGAAIAMHRIHQDLGCRP